jgi:hypothetical protein
LRKSRHFDGAAEVIFVGLSRYFLGRLRAGMIPSAGDHPIVLVVTCQHIPSVGTNRFHAKEKDMNDQISSGTQATASQDSGSMEQAKTGFKESVKETKEKIRHTAKEVASQAKETGEEYVQKSRTRAAERIEGASTTVRQAADRFEEQHDPNIAHYTRLVANKLEHAAVYVRERDLRGLQHDTEDWAREHPTLFFGGLFVAGFAAARFLKASADRNSSKPYESNQATATEG